MLGSYACKSILNLILYLHQGEFPCSHSGCYFEIPLLYLLYKGYRSKNKTHVSVFDTSSHDSSIISAFLGECQQLMGVYLNYYQIFCNMIIAINNFDFSAYQN